MKDANGSMLNAARRLRRNGFTGGAVALLILAIGVAAYLWRWL